MSKEVVLCVSNAYQKKYYLNENFNGLPQTIRDELKIMCVLYTEETSISEHPARKTTFSMTR